MPTQYCSEATNSRVGEGLQEYPSRKRHMHDQPNYSVPNKVFRPTYHETHDLENTNKKLKRKIKNLQQQLRRSKKRMATMGDIISNLKENLMVKSEIADRLYASFDKLQLSIFHNTKNNNNTSACGRRYTDDIKEFALTLHY